MFCKFLEIILGHFAGISVPAVVPEAPAARIASLYAGNKPLCEAFADVFVPCIAIGECHDANNILVLPLSEGEVAIGVDINR